jgi:microcystin-dependent protein
MDPFVGEIALFAFAYPPQGWALCDGQLLPILQNQALFALLGTTYGGDGVSNFALPDLRGRAAMHVSTIHQQGRSGGSETVSLAVNQIPAHGHPANCNNGAGTVSSPAGAYWAANSNGNTTFSSTAGAAMAAQAAGVSGTNAAHDNMAPFQVVNFCIALVGIFPSRN